MLFSFNKVYFRRLLSPGIYGIFGKPRAGKTTVAAAVIAENYARKSKFDRFHSSSSGFVRFFGLLYRWRHPFFENVYCTDPTIKNCNIVKVEDLGKWQLPDYSLLVLEECGLLYDNRRYNSFTKDDKHLFAMVGHNKSSILYSSQTADIDKQIRVRSHSMIMVSKFVFGLSLVRPIKYEFGVDNETGDMKDIYSTPQGFFSMLISFLRREAWLFRRRPYYKYFDSYVDDYEYKLQSPSLLKELSDNVYSRAICKRLGRKK